MADDADYAGVDGEDEEIIDGAEDTCEVDEDGGIDSGNVRPELKKLYSQHPELIVDYIESVQPLLDSKEHHKTYPFMTIYEKTKIIGLRANQLSQGARPYVVIPEHITNVRDIARLELEQKRLPFIIKRPIPNGHYEYWRISDLIIL